VHPITEIVAYPLLMPAAGYPKFDSFSSVLGVSARNAKRGTIVAISLRGCRLKIREDGGQMRSFVTGTKVFAFFLLFFANSLVINGQPGSLYRLPAGTKILLRMDDGISSEFSSANDSFTTSVVTDIVIREVVVLPAGTVVRGYVEEVSRAESAGRSGKINIKLDLLQFDNGDKRAIEGVLVKDLKAASSTKATLLSVVGGTALGAVLGAATGSDGGALIGAGLGGGIGTGVALLRKGKDVGIRDDEEFEIELKKEVILPVRDY
jgi:hypothetical protein